jgi:hypothetical protein
MPDPIIHVQPIADFVAHVVFGLGALLAALVLYGVVRVIREL